MAEAPPSNRYVNGNTISEAIINTVTTASRSLDEMVCSGTIEMDLLLCDYAKLRKVTRSAEKTTIDKKLQVA